MKLTHAVVGLTISAAAMAGPGDVVKIIRAPKPVQNGSFGVVAVVQGHLVVSSPNDTVGGIPNVGSVYRFNGISRQVALHIPNPDPDPDGTSDSFGDTLFTVGPNILMGASGDDLDNDPLRTNAGSVYLVDARTGAWLKIPNPEPNSGDMFSCGALGHLGNNLIVGAPFDDPSGLLNAGTVYVIDPTTGAVVLRIPHPEPLLYGNSDDRFGRSVAGHEGNILVGAPADDIAGHMTGGAYLLEGKTGAVLLRIPNPDPQQGVFDAFGYPVRSFGGKIVISAPWHQTGGKDLGVVHVFDGKTGALQYTIQHPKPTDQVGRASFGWSLAYNDGFLAVGASQDDVLGYTDAGSVYVFDLNTGQLVLSIHDPNPVAYDNFGGSVEFHGGQIVTGARSKDFDGLTNAGEVYVFEGPRR